MNLNTISEWIVVLLGIGCLLLITFWVWWRVFDEILKLFEIKKELMQFIFDRRVKLTKDIPLDN